jgi:arylsulfatase A-like enzyme
MRFVLALLAVFVTAVPASSNAAIHSRHVVLIVWDGMRPDFISEEHTPTLARLARDGVTFRNHHAVYLSSTEVNGTAISTGSYPSHSGLVGNNEYRPEIEISKPIHTEALEAARKGDSLSNGHYIRVPTIAEIVRKAGGHTVVAGAKPVALLADRAARVSDAGGVSLFAGTTLPPSLRTILTNEYGAFPGDTSVKPSRIDWTTGALIDSLWAKGVPEFSFVWMNEPDLSQHLTGPGSERTLAAMSNSDKNLARILHALEVKGVRETTDVMIVSDHGASTIGSRFDVADLLSQAGIPAVREFKAKPATGEILVVSNGGSTLVYVIGHDQAIIRRVVGFLQQAEFCGVIFCREPLPGTFALHEAQIDSESAPDIFVSMRWTKEKNKNGIAGIISSDVSTYGPGQGSHVSLSPFDMHATLVASGPHFRTGVVDTLASGNVDVAPTVLWILGLKPPKAMDGRVLTEALTIKGAKVHSFEPRHIEASTENNGTRWTQYLNFTEVNGVRYLDEGNGGQN